MEQFCEKLYKCRLCGKLFSAKEMSDEHYPARSVGNTDIVALNIVDVLDSLYSEENKNIISERIKKGESIQKISDDIFDTQLAKPLYPNGRTVKSLCIECNRFLGKYDEAYLKFFNVGGEPKSIKGFQKQTKYNIIKAIYAKFLSLPEASAETFDFIDFITDTKATTYNGKWHLYFTKRNHSADFLGFKDIGTDKGVYQEGTVYDLTDDKFIFNLLNFNKHSSVKMNDIFDILDKQYILTEENGSMCSYHNQILLGRMASSAENDE